MSQNSNCFAVDVATGEATVGKGALRGAYTLKVQVTAAGGSGARTV